MSKQSNIKRQQKIKEIKKSSKTLAPVEKKATKAFIHPEFIEKLKEKNTTFNINQNTEENTLKSSDVLLEFAKPLTSKCRTEAEWKTAIDVSVLAWNKAMQSDNDPMKMLSKFIDTDAIDSEANAMTEMMLMIKRKEDEFAKYRFTYEDYMLSLNQGRVFISVSTRNVV